MNSCVDDTSLLLISKRRMLVTCPLMAMMFSRSPTVLPGTDTRPKFLPHLKTYNCIELSVAKGEVCNFCILYIIHVVLMAITGNTCV